MNAPKVRQISVPTTIAGGEFSAIAGVTNQRTKVKEMLRHELVMPRAAILDPAVTVHTPEWLLLSTGIRAVDHCVEGLCSREAHPYADAQALKGLSMLAQALPRVKADAGDLDARMECQIGTWLSMGPLSAGVPMGASHGIGYVLGAVYDVPHGFTSCVMLPSVMRWNRSENAERQALVSAAMGQPGKDAADVLDNFIRGLGMPRSLQDVRLARSISTGSRNRRWERPGFRETRARSIAPRRCAKFFFWLHRGVGDTMYTGKHAHLRPLQPAFVMANSGETVTLPSWRRAAIVWRTCFAIAV